MYKYDGNGNYKIENQFFFWFYLFSKYKELLFNQLKCIISHCLFFVFPLTCEQGISIEIIEIGARRVN